MQAIKIKNDPKVVPIHSYTTCHSVFFFVLCYYISKTKSGNSSFRLDLVALVNQLILKYCILIKMIPQYIFLNICSQQYIQTCGDQGTYVAAFSFLHPLILRIFL